MKSPTLAKSLLTLSAFTGAAALSHATILATWDFNSLATGEINDADGNTFLADDGPQTSASLLVLAANDTTSTIAIRDQGTTLNAFDSAPAGNDLRTQRAVRGNGTTLNFTFNMEGLRDAELTFAGYRTERAGSSTGPSEFQASYSVDGLTFTDFGTAQLFNTSSFTIMTVTAPSALDNQTTAVIRLTLSGATGSVGDSGSGARFDNFQIAAVPEPSTYAALLGLLALGFVAYRRRR